MGHLLCIDKNEGENADGDLMFGIGLEHPRGLLNLFIVSGEGGLDELYNLLSSERIEIDIGLHIYC